MPRSPMKPCFEPGCPNLCSGTYCESHKKTTGRQSARLQRNPAHQVLYDWQWQKASRLFLVEHPLCIECERNGVIRPARETDHIVAHRGDYNLFWNRKNWQPLCKTCHSQKTNKEKAEKGD